MTAGAWITLIVAGFIETGWAIGLKYTQGFRGLVPSVETVLFMIGSFYFLPDRWTNSLWVLPTLSGPGLELSGRRLGEPALW